MRSLFEISDQSSADIVASLEAGLGSSADALVINVRFDSSSLNSHVGEGVVRVCDWISKVHVERDRPKLYARIPVLDWPNSVAVLGAFVAAGIDGIMLPKALGGHDVTRLDARISVEEAVHGRDNGSVRIIAEAAVTARAALALATFRGASHRLSALIWNARSLAFDLGGITTLDANGQLRAPIAWARAQVLLAAAAAEVFAIESAGDSSLDSPAFRDLLEASHGDGFGAVMTSNADTIAIIAEIMGRRSS